MLEILLAIVVVMLVYERARLLAQVRNLEKRVAIDPLTGLLSKEGGHHEMRRVVAQCMRSTVHGFVFMYMDLDGFKTINDIHGHHMGDRAVQEFANVLRAYSRAEDVVVRLHGDEFVLMLDSHLKDEMIAKRMRTIELAYVERLQTLDIAVQGCGVSYGYERIHCEQLKYRGRKDANEHLEGLLILTENRMRDHKKNRGASR